MLSQAAITQYGVDGYYRPVAVYAGDEAADLRRHLEAIEADHGSPLKGRHRVKAHLLFPFLNEVVRHPPILDAVEDLIGPDILCWASNLFVKESREPSYVPWHQDATYWGLDASSGVTAWLALTDSTPAHGNLRVVSGTHHALIAHTDTNAKDSALPRGQEIPVRIDDAAIVDITLRAGEMSLHHPLIHHGSGANAADDRRIGFAIRYFPSTSRQPVDEDDSATLVRGEDGFGHFDLEPQPTCDWDPPLVALHDRLTRRAKARAERARHQWSTYAEAFDVR